MDEQNNPQDPRLFEEPPRPEPEYLSYDQQQTAGETPGPGEPPAFDAAPDAAFGPASDAAPKGKKPPKPPKSKEVLEYEAARKEYFRSAVLRPWLAPVLALVSICLVTSLLLGLTNELTAPLIEANQLAEAESTRKRLLPEADAFTQVQNEAFPEAVTAMYKADNGAGWVVEAYGQGYGGKVPAMVAFDAAGGILGVEFMENNETPGLGQKLVSDAGFAAQFAGRPAQNIGLGEVDKIASATISTGAGLNAVNAAIEAYGIEVLGQAAAQTPEEVREALLPGEALTPITIESPNVQPTAYRSDAGNYIIYGEKPSEREDSDSVTVAAVAMDENGVILNLWIDTSGDSPQYGQTLMRNQPFLDSFKGESLPVQVDAVADITGSSTSVMTAVNTALGALPLAKEAG